MTCKYLLSKLSVKFYGNCLNKNVVYNKKCFLHNLTSIDSCCAIKSVGTLFFSKIIVCLFIHRYMVLFNSVMKYSDLPVGN